MLIFIANKAWCIKTNFFLKILPTDAPSNVQSSLKFYIICKHQTPAVIFEASQEKHRVTDTIKTTLFNFRFTYYLFSKTEVIHLPEKVRVSIGSAIVLKLIKGKLNVAPTTIYLLTYYPDKCSANCGFCPQAKLSKSKPDLLSRVTWPPFPTEAVVSRVSYAFEENVIKRICVQSLNYPGVFNDVLDLVEKIKAHTQIPISISCQPMATKKMQKLVEAGVNRISIPLDAATAELFEKTKGDSVGGPYRWEKHRRALMRAVKTFGKGCVSTHLIIGLGETEKQTVKTLQWCVDLGVYPSLFAFTPVSGTALEKLPQPSIGTYRRIQIARHLIMKGQKHCEEMKYDDEGRLIGFGVSQEQLWQEIKNGSPFVTSGCPGCNRPYYNEKPSGPIYNYPQIPLSKEIIEINEQIGC
jgi:biotin synthase